MAGSYGVEIGYGNVFVPGDVVSGTFVAKEEGIKPDGVITRSSASR